ncbi:MAG: LamG domain-containing protein, partial [Leptolyngbyaceae cyanobacterium SM2_5_2]|nr:LamG domain-containing protein [Leptolyngbyaceae cyanobacterium SM2_5_2]
FTEGRRYAFTLRTGNTGSDGAGRFVQGGNVQAGQMVHLVYTRDAAGNAVLYINGQAQGRENLPGNLKTSWDSRYRLGLGKRTQRRRTLLAGRILPDRHLQPGANRQRGNRPLASRTRESSAARTTALRLAPNRPPAQNQWPVSRPASGFPAPGSGAPCGGHRAHGSAHGERAGQPSSPEFGGESLPGAGISDAPEPPSGSALAIQVAAVELLCLETASGTLRPVASYLFDRQQLAGDPNALSDLSQQWALETHRRLAPESTIAVLRFREIQAAPGEVQPGQAPLVTRYRFQVLAVPQPAPLAKRMFALRSDVRQRRSRSGHFGGSTMPLLPHPIELAPPQTTGVQPLYLEPSDHGTGNGTGDFTQHWPWGLSGLRLSVQYSALQQPLLGSTPGDTVPPTLWWQAPNYAVQYRSAGPAQPELPTAGLPPYYRPGAIKTLLPVLPTLPMPGAASLVSSLGLSTHGATNAEEASGAPPAWQPILPGHLRYLLTGDRPGAMMVIRNQLLKQVLAANEPLLVSGSVPVQHRVPRPVALPPNTPLDKALQPWASYFEPRRNLLATTAPTDEAFFADCGGRPAQRLRLQMQSPQAGAIAPAWDWATGVSHRRG